MWLQSQILPELRQVQNRVNGQVGYPIIIQSSHTHGMAHGILRPTGTTRKIIHICVILHAKLSFKIMTSLLKRQALLPWLCSF